MPHVVRFWNGLPFINRLLVVASVFLLSAGSLMLFVTASQDAKSMGLHVQGELARDLETLPAALAEAAVVGDLATMQQTLDRYVRHSSLVAAEFRDATGARLSSRHAPIDAQVPQWFLVLFEIADVSGSVDVSVGGRSYGTLALTAGAHEHSVRLWRKLQVQLSLLLLAIVAFALVLWIVLRRGLAPLKYLEVATHQLAAGRFDIRLAPASNAEFEPIIEAFNHMAENVQRSQQQLRESELLLRSSIDTIGEAFAIYGPDDRLVYCNEEYRELYDQSRPVIEPGRSFEEIIRYGVAHGQYKEAIGREEEWIADRLTAHRRPGSTHIQQLGNGRWLKVSERRTTNGYILGFRVDVSDLFKAKEAAEAASVAKGRFLATMSHEIRTPLNGILGMAQLLQAAEVSAEHRVEYAEIIHHSGQALLNLLNDILDLSQVETGRMELASVAFDPVRLLDDIQCQFAEQARSKNLRLHGAWLGTAQSYAGDPQRLHQMLANLVSNAIKFTAHGEVRIEAREVDRSGTVGLLEFSVTDTGIGIAEDKLDLLFRPFSQADGTITRQYGGTGLGLSIVRSMAQLMGGDVGVESVPGTGSRFWFRIRAARATASVDTEQAAAVEPVTMAADELLPEFDANAMLTQVGNDRELAGLLLEAALSDMPDYLARLTEAVAAGDWTSAERSVHTMKGLLAQIGGSRLSGRMKMLNQRLKSGAHIDAATVRELQAEYAGLEVLLRAWSAGGH